MMQNDKIDTLVCPHCGHLVGDVDEMRSNYTEALRRWRGFSNVGGSDGEVDDTRTQEPSH
jgi:hypothetical protein